MPDQNRFLHGPFAPVEEELTVFDLPVTGSVPAGLYGRYLRNGPNPLGLEDPGYRFWEGHWFLGPGMVHGVRLRDGKAEWYRNRWVRSRQLAEALGEKWPAGPVHADMDFAANTHIIAHAGRYLATVEAGPLPYALSGELDTVGPCDFDGTLPGGYAAHTKLDRRTGELHAVAYFWAWDHVQHIVIGADGTVRRTTDVPVPDGPMMHDFALTELRGPPRPAGHLQHGRGIGGTEAALHLEPAHQARIGLLPRRRRRGPLGRGRPVLGLPRPERLRRRRAGRGRPAVTRAPTTSRSSRGRAADPGPLDHRPGTGKVPQQQLDDRAQEFPRIDERVTGRPHRYGYSAVIAEVGHATVSPVGDFANDACSNALLKHDLAAGSVQAH